MNFDVLRVRGLFFYIIFLGISTCCIEVSLVLHCTAHNFHSVEGSVLEQCCRVFREEGAVNGRTHREGHIYFVLKENNILGTGAVVVNKHTIY